ncbi:MAG: hypothetical protein LBR47_04565 [Spirochaetaceae bacterium]|jgi:tetratricopeptide (TPR) repeat protein|nr:hypothetical protein [Spirochaetaceae bacterium]
MYRGHIFAAICCFLLISSYITAQTPVKPEPETYSWRVLAQAETAFEQGEYGTALMLAEQAWVNKKNETGWRVSVLTEALKPAEVRRVGDTISSVIWILEERQSADALEILDDLLRIHGSDFFDNSITQLVSYISAGSVYPESRYLMGRIYIREGEYKLAEEYLLAAWNEREYLNVPSLDYSILYELAGLAGLNDEYTKYEEYLLLILAHDEAFGQPGNESPLLHSVLRILDTGITLDKLFELYRHNAYMEIPAYNQLAAFYLRSGRTDRALSVSLLGSLSAFTRIYNAVEERDIGFTYVSFAEVLKKMLSYPVIRTWAEENSIRSGFELFADILAASGKRVLAAELTGALAVWE